jgi:hypothetical protein
MPARCLQIKARPVHLSAFTFLPHNPRYIQASKQEGQQGFLYTLTKGSQALDLYTLLHSTYISLRNAASYEKEENRGRMFLSTSSSQTFKHDDLSLSVGVFYQVFTFSLPSQLGPTTRPPEMDGLLSGSVSAQARGTSVRKEVRPTEPWPK